MKRKRRISLALMCSFAIGMVIATSVTLKSNEDANYMSLFAQKANADLAGEIVKLGCTGGSTLCLANPQGDFMKP